MSPNDRRAAARRRAWGRGPMILRFEPLEGRQLLAASPQGKPDLVATAFDTVHNLDWGDTFHAVGQISNRGNATTEAPFKVDIFASPGPAISRASVYLGSAVIPAGLAPGQTAAFDQSLTLPSIAMPATNSTQAVFIDLRVNPDNTVVEGNRGNNERQGQGLDISVIDITPHVPANLVGTAIGVTPNSVSWGDPITITAQVMNNAQGDAPATRTRVVLTPAGLTPGGPADVTIGSFAVPAIPAFQTVNIVHPITLPAAAPSTLAGSTQFTLTLVHDADFQTNTALSHQTAQGVGFDQAQLSILASPSQTAKPALADLAASGIIVPSQPVFWGQNVQISTAVQNLGPADAGPFRVRFLLTGANGTIADSLFLGDAQISGLKAGFTQTIQQTVQIPTRLPNGLQLNSVGNGRILVWVDPENTVDETIKSNNLSSSAPIVLKLLGADGTTTVPSLPSGNTTATYGGSSASQAHPLTKAKSRPLNPRLKKQNHGLKLFGKRIERFFRDVGSKLSVTGSSHH